MSIFNQQGQSVNHQYNAGRDINFANIVNEQELGEELQKLLLEVSKARQGGIIENNSASKVENAISKASEETRKDKPNKKTIVDHLTQAKSVLEGMTSATSLVVLITQAIAAVKGLFL